MLATIGLLLVAIVASYALGSKWIAPDEVVRALLGAADATSEGIVGGLRASRTALGLLCGAALGAAGVLMQALTRNPVADPGLLGVNAGASLGVVAGIAVLGSVGVTAAIGFALVGAAGATAAVFALATARFAEASPVRLTLAGVAMAAVFSGAAQAIVVLDERVLDAFRFWQVGSLSARSIGDVGAPVIIGVLVCLAGAVLLAPSLNALALGDDSATALGVSPRAVRLAGLVVLTGLCAIATALAGPISFVGLAVAHAARLLVGPDHRVLLPLAILAGPAVLLLSDVLGRLIGLGAEVPVGIVTAFVGAPLLAVFVIGVRRRALA